MDNLDDFQNPYDIWLEWHLLKECNLNCKYCFHFPVKRLKKPLVVPVDQVMNVLERTGKIFRIGLTGGEPFLVSNLTELAVALTKKHYITSTTNITSPAVISFADNIDPKRVISITASLHIEELFTKKLEKMYVKNFLYLKKKGFNLIPKIVAHPSLLKVPEYIKYFEENGVPIYDFMPFNGMYHQKKYPDQYNEEELNFFHYKAENIFTVFSNSDKTCNVGYNVGIIKPSGDIFPCYWVVQKLGNIYKEINLNHFMLQCPAKVCTCPFNRFDPGLFQTAQRISNHRIKKINPVLNQIKLAHLTVFKDEFK